MNYYNDLKKGLKQAIKIERRKDMVLVNEFKEAPEYVLYNNNLYKLEQYMIPDISDRSNIKKQEFSCCDDCLYWDKDEDEYPCKDCSHAHIDKFVWKN